MLNRTPPVNAHPQAPRPDFSGSRSIDLLYQATMDSRESPDEALLSLWGPITEQSASTYVYVEGVGSKIAAAGAGVFFGIGATQNLSLVVPGPYFRTAERVRIFAIHETLRTVSPMSGLVIFCTSKAVIRQLCYSAASNITLGWPGPNGDIFKSTVKLLSSRHAQTCFVHVDSNDTNDPKRQAFSLAKAAQKLQALADDLNFTPADIFLPSPKPVLPLNGKHKVYTELSEISPPLIRRAQSTHENAIFHSFH
ncbi:hypothetical protein C8R43DRAFT_882080 [Mycena crocata]|nr:hypothetical protein C8R43DRAFT_882080 [Mycena crocata]